MHIFADHAQVQYCVQLQKRRCALSRYTDICIVSLKKQEFTEENYLMKCVRTQLLPNVKQTSIRFNLQTFKKKLKI